MLTSEEFLDWNFRFADGVFLGISQFKNQISLIWNGGASSSLNCQLKWILKKKRQDVRTNK